MTSIALKPSKSFHMSVIRSFKPAKNLSETSYSSVAINIPGVHKCLSFKNSQEKKEERRVSDL